jgi:glyoxylase I family protein
MTDAKLAIESILHASFICADLQASLHFYHDVLDMQIDAQRPDLGYPGAWLNVGNAQIHLLHLPNPDPVTGRPQHGGRDRHVALGIRALDGLIERLEQHGINYTVSRSGRRALFVRDPDGNALEFIEAPAKTD